MDVDEVSAFQVDDEEPSESQVQVEQLNKLRSEQLAERQIMEAKYMPLNLDSAAVKFFFKSLR